MKITDLICAVIVLAVATSPCRAQLPPEKSDITPAADLRVQLFANEPQLVCPSAIDVDEHGRIWIAEAVNYRGAAGPKSKEPPYYRTPFRKTGDRIVVLEDTDGDGKCDTARVFAEGLDLTAPKGLAVIGDRVWISQSPNIMTIEIKPDGTAGKRETVLTGFGGTHGDHSVHSVTLGPDGRLYGCFGDTGCDVKFPDGRRLVTDGKPWRGGCVFRMNHDLTGAEILAHNFRNGYEVAVDSFGNLFMSDNDEDDGNQFCRLAYVMEGGNYGFQPYQKGFDWNLESPGVCPILMRTGAGAPAGLCVYEGKLLPSKYHGMPILAECGAGWLGGPRLAPDGAGFRLLDFESNDPYAIRSPEKLLSSADRWFRPSDSAVAPDGSLFVADFYNHVAGGRDLAKELRGRVYRLLPKDHDGTYRVTKLDLETPAGLIEALGSPNQARRARAILRLKEMDAKDALAILAPHAKSADRILKARVLYQLGQFGKDGEAHVRAALTDGDPDIRIVAIRSLKQIGADLPAVAKSLIDDPAPQVRRELLLALRQTPTDAAGDAIIAMAKQYDGKNRYYLEAVGIACRGRGDAFIERLMNSWKEGEWNATFAGIIGVVLPDYAIKAYAGIVQDRKRSLDDRKLAIKSLAAWNDPIAGSIVASIVIAKDTPRELLRPAMADLARMVAGPWRVIAKRPDAPYMKLFDAANDYAKDPALHPEALALSRALGTRPLVQWMVSQPTPKSKDKGPETVDQPELLPDWTRAPLPVDGMIVLPPERSPRGDRSVSAATLLNVKEGFKTRIWVGSNAAVKVWLNQTLIVKDTGRPSGAPRQFEVTAFLHSGTNRLLIQADEAPKNWSFVVELEDRFGQAIEATDQSLPKITAPASQRIDPKSLPPDRELLALKGDGDRGRQVFLRTKANCASCHKINGEGGTLGVGPALDGLGVKMSREAILAELLRPSQSIGQQYVVWNIETKDGKIALGIVVDDSPERVTLKDARGVLLTLKTGDIAERRRSEVSLMPELLAGEFTRQELADLIQYLASLK